MLDNAHGLVIGIADYQDPNVETLPPQVINDARSIYEVLVAPERCAYPEETVQLLLNEEVTGTALRQALADLAQGTDAESTVFIYLSSHGGRITAGDQAGEYILPVDVDISSQEVFADTAISGQAFTEALHAIPARKLLVVLDCCHAGGIGQPKRVVVARDTLPLEKGFSEAYYDELKSGQGRVILASARSDEYAYVLSTSDENSLFTRYLLAGLKGGVASDDGFVRIFDLFEYLQPKVTGDQPNQHPIFKAELEENFPVALYLGGQKGTVPKDEQGFRYDVYISYADVEPDAGYVWQTLVPRLEEAGLQPARIAISGDVEDPGVSRVVGIERAIEQSKRVLLVISQRYVQDEWTHFIDTLSQFKGVDEGKYPLLPVKIDDVDDSQIPLRIRQLALLDLTHPYRADRNFSRLVRALNDPVPTRFD